MNKFITAKPWKLYFKVFLFWLVNFSLAAQNQILKSIDAAGISTIEIDGDEIFMIEILSSDRKSILIESLVDGEYQNDFQITTLVTQDILQLNLQRRTYVQIQDDKRNAHKVIAAKLKLKLPHQMNLVVRSNIASLELKGKYKSIKASLSQGFFKLIGTAKSASIQTVDGDISVKTKQTEVLADSKHGLVEIFNFENTLYSMKLNSIYGNIFVEKF